MTISLTEGGPKVCFRGKKPTMKNILKTPVWQSDDDLEEVAENIAAAQGPR